MFDRRKRRRVTLRVALSSVCLIVSSLPVKVAGMDQFISCSIQTKRTVGLFVLQGVATSKANVSGHYTLVIRKKNGAGNSQSIQQGDFSLQPGAERVLTTVALEEGAEGHVSASMTLDTNFGRTTCLFPQ